MKHTKRMHLGANNPEVGNIESEITPGNKTNMISTPWMKCFVCDKEITREGISLMMGYVPYSKTSLPKKIGELMGDGFMIIICEKDLLCKTCASMLNYVDKLEVDLEIIKKALTKSLKTKYNLLNSEGNDITAPYIKKTTVRKEITKRPEFDVSVFIQSTDDSIQFERSKSSASEKQEIQTVKDSKKESAVHSSSGEGTNGSGRPPGTLKHSNETKRFKCSQCNMWFKSHLETEEHLLSHLRTPKEQVTEPGSRGNSDSRKQTLYQCHVCTFQTANLAFLHKHSQIHLKQPVYQCTLCPKRFQSKTYLLKHMDIHCVFKCSFCSQKYTESSQLLRHLQVHKRSGTKSKQETVEISSADITLKDRQHQLQSSTCNSNFKKKEMPMKTEAQSSVEDSSRQKDLLSLKDLGVDYSKIEELMAKLHADDVPCSSNEENSVSENKELEDSTTNDCLKTEESSQSCTDNANTVSLAETKANSTCDNIGSSEGKTSEQANKDNTDILENVGGENTDPLEGCIKEETDELPKKSKTLPCSVCGLKLQSDCELKEHLTTHQTSESGTKECRIRMYECYICSRNFTSQVYLTRHLGKHGTSFKKIHCKLCSEEIIDEVHLSQHMRKVHRAFLQCFYCNQEFTTKEELEQHELAHPENSTHRCNLCKKRFVSEIRLRTHLKNVHTNVPGDEMYKCNLCSKSLTTFYNLKRHLRNHEKCEKNAKCIICSQVLTDKLHLRQHIEDMHASVYQCAFCRQAFSNRKMCRTHELMHPERYVHKCDSCPSSFTDVIGLEKHKSIFHRDPICKFCGKEINNPIKLLNHERRHVLYKNSFPCKHCTKVFRTPSGLKYHMSSHTGKYAVYCEICGRGLNSEVLLEEHMASHTKEARYTCDVCGRSFSARSTYRLHRKWHDDPLPYRCKYCNRRFKHTSVRAVHIRRTHTGERPYKCPHCPRSFSVSSTMHKHVILHTRNYPYKCKHCSKGFIARSKLACHLAKGHGDYEMMNSKPACQYKMALKPSEMPSAPSEAGPPESYKNATSGVRFEETVIEEQIVEPGQTVFWF